jgi:arginase
MSERSLKAILVPYDVESRDTPAARAPRELLARRFLERLAEMGWEADPVEIHVDGAGKAETVVAVGRAVAQAVAQARQEGRFPLVLSGSCLASAGVLTGLQEEPGSDPVVVWIDAHGDFNTPESSPSGYWDGMALATLCGSGLPEVARGIGLRPLPVSHVVHLAGRDFDLLEEENLRLFGLATVPPDEIVKGGALERLRRSAGGRPLYFHVDLDGLDPGDAPAVSFPVPGGPDLEEILHALRAFPPPAAMTLSALSFAKASGAEAVRTIDTCVRLVDAFAARLS